MHATSRWALGALLAMGVVSLGCGPTVGPQASPQALAQETSQRLEGDWRLVQFVPAEPLSPTLQAMLEYQYQVLVVHIRGGRIVAESPGIHFDRRYEVREVRGDVFKLISYDEGGVPYESWCRFEPDGIHLSVQSLTSPWRGTATLARLAPPR